ncbi:LisH domain-containing protein [Meloidogyne graminicola]|uniref:LisH domain-containing protein n=1 Tax=Meloidogyne graminicola TaxID=189291 RepID=A0A8S9ZY45_9BILA|nr:LisH domain-containing protein [Meloidogyne graminicola]
MFQHVQQPQMNPQQQRKEPQQFISAEAQSREKLSHFVYEYLVHMGASKSADTFKNEVLAHSNGNPNIQIDISAAPGFLSSWFSVFWDLYSVHSDKKDKAEPSNDAKTYHKMMFPPGGFPEGMVNGGGIYGPPGFHNPNLGHMGGLPPPPSQNLQDGMFPVGYFNGMRGGPQPGPSQSSNQASPIPGGPSNRFAHQQGTRSGAPTPSNNFQPPPQMNAALMNEQMRMVIVQQQRQAAQQGRMPINLALAGHPRQQLRPQFCPPQPYMDSPSGTPPFPGSLPLNGTSVSSVAAAMCSSASLMSPSAGIPQQQLPPGALVGGALHGQMQGTSGECGTGGGPGSSDANFMMMNSGGGPQSGIQSQFLTHNDGGNGGGAGVSSAVSIRQQIDVGADSVGGDLNAIGNNGGNQQQNSQLHSLLNGTGGGPSGDMSMEIKHSPASVHHFGSSGNGSGCQQPGGGLNGGTPTSGGGPLGSVGGPSSVHSQQSGSNNVVGGKIQQQPPISEALDMTGHLGNHQSDEISKIKASLMEGYSQTHQFQQQ